MLDDKIKVDKKNKKVKKSLKEHATHPFHEHLDSWTKLSQHCQHLASMAALYPKSAFHPEAAKTPSYAEACMFGFFGHVTPMHAIGPSRENLEMLQQGQPLFADFMQSLLDYQPILGEVWLEAWKRTLTKVDAAMKQEETLTTRQLYDLWIECGEQTYAEVVTKDDYQKIYGKFANALLACKNHNQSILEEIFRNMNLPTKQDLNSAYERIQVLAREVREHKKDIADLKEKAHATC